MHCLYIVNGLPASGKSTLASRLAPLLKVPCLSKDDIKERLSQVYPPHSVNASEKLGMASFDLLYLVVSRVLMAGRSCLIEAPFNPKYAMTEISTMVQKYQAVPIEIYCHCDEEVRRQRFVDRAMSGQRHQVHLDSGRSVAQPHPSSQPLGLNDHVCLVDATHGVDWQIDDIIDRLRSYDCV